MNRVAEEIEIEAEHLAARGIAREEVERQLDLFRNPPGYADLVRPCAIGDGIESLGEDERAASLAAYERARDAGRLSKFVPASGAASRMFQALQSYRDADCGLVELERMAADGDAKAEIVVRCVNDAAQLPFAAELDAELRRRGSDLRSACASGDLRDLVDAMVGDEGLDLAAVPKGLLPFHRYPGAVRTAFEEHLREAVELVRDGDGRVRLHFTVSPEHVSAFEEALDGVRRDIEKEGDSRLEVGFSTQSPSTDTIAVDLADQPFRDGEGRLVFRPGGHGALLDNLAHCGADIALLQNIDNIQPDRGRADSLYWKKLLIGRLVRLEELRASALATGKAGHMRDVAGAFGIDPGADSDLVRLLDRPIRVGGVVANTGEPGGGPFWVRGDGGTITRQIIESAQVDPDSPEQQRIFRGASHFNPVLLACSLRDLEGRPYELERFVDRRAVFIAKKSFEGRDLKALERPGLWNGSMAYWGTVFMEIGAAAFTPVKTVVDLLRAEHQA